MGSIRQFAGQTIIYGLGSVLSKLVYYLLVVVLLTYLLEGRRFEFGIYGEFYGYLAVLLIFFSLKLDTALFRYGNRDDAFNNAFNTTASIALCSAITIIILAFSFDDALAALLQYPDKAYYIRWFALILAFDVFSLVPFASLRLENKARIFAGLKIFNVAFSSLLIIFFLIVFPKVQDFGLFSLLPLFEYQIDYVILTNVISSALVLILLLYYVRGFQWRIDFQLLKKIIPYVTPLIIVGVCNNFIQYNGAAVIKYLSPQDGLLDKLSSSGIFDSSRRLAGLFVLFIGAFNYAAEPFFFKNSSARDRKELYGKICHLFTLIGGLLILGMVFGLELLKYGVGRDFRESLFIIPILLIAYLFMGIYHNFSIWYKLSDNTIWGAVISIVGVVITLFICIMYIPQIGYVAFAWANLASYFAMMLISYMLGQRLFPISYPLLKLFLSISLVAGFVILGILAKASLSESLYYLVCFVLMLAYLSYAYLIEKDEWKNMIFRNRSSGNP